MNDRTSIIVSLIVHIVILAFILITPRAQTNLREKYVPIEVESFQEQIEQPEPEPPEPEPVPEEKPEEKPKLSDKITDLLKNELKKTPTPTPKKKKPTPTPKPTRKQVTKKPTPKPKTPTPTPIPREKLIPLDQLPRVAKSTPAPTVKSASPSEYKMSIEAGDTNVDFTSYAVTLATYLKRNWRPPTSRRPERKEYVTIASFTVHRDGLISDVVIEESSGWKVLDQSILEAIKRTNGAHKLPANFTNNSIRVRFPFILPLN